LNGQCNVVPQETKTFLDVLTIELVTECDECPCQELDKRAITLEQNMLQQIPTFMHNTA